MSEWVVKNLDEVVEYFIDYRGKTPDKKDSGIPLITAKIVKDGRLNTATEFISVEDYPLWMTRGYPEVNDVVLTTEAPLGEVALIKNKNVALAQRIITLRGYKNILDNKFLKYWLQSEQGQYELESRASGTTVFGIKSSILKKIPIFLPPYNEQVTISSILHCIDEKIDLLHRQNKTLESMAETLFRQWFIEEAQEDWKTYKLSDVSDIFIGRTPPRKETHWFSKDPKDIKWLSIKDMAESGIYRMSTAEYLPLTTIEKFKIPMIPENTVILSFKMTVGRVGITSESMVSNEAIAQFRIKKIITKEFLYCFLKAFNYDALGTTSTIVTSINSSLIRSMEFCIPNDSDHRISNFTSITSPLFIKTMKNQEQIRSLSNLRNTLLPKLMSGEVQVQYAEEAIASVA
ncbi:MULTISPECIES: restriction endonuclease subunit S [Enterobacteriaceae]|uniref:restriction endonuclease subunit S n=2 Tax=Enterobacterales TaxID=91347 RepID=UPI000CD37AA6|nr:MULTISPECIES: restriction endonuclease subunit S [Enterobacteriaceae]AUW13922.1 restriction endonuclease subunit S [Klebsiella oxytoca]HCB1434311.1 restriction endonuclease subunit S [Citrobacter braakii]EJR7283590.1 restriction endonuclease subunit S [Citrobacter freundii]EKX5683004.1 restriction endonuclease subunit S [Citrobacter freundii]ELG9958945.1 restriction endonuclease subunit S [Citrobacter freundii]